MRKSRSQPSQPFIPMQRTRNRQEASNLGRKDIDKKKKKKKKKKM